MIEPYVIYLPTLNAMLNSLATVFIVTGLFAIKNRNEVLHQNMMRSAFVVSALFLSSYLVYHYYVGSVPFEGQGWIRWVYFSILIPHIVLAIVVTPMILVTIYYAITEQRLKHRRLAKWTSPLWLFVSVSGVVVYLMLYHLDVGSEVATAVL